MTVDQPKVFSMLIIRPSSLDTWNDCQGRWAVTNLPSLKKKVSGKQAFIGQLFGTAAHKAIASTLAAKAEGSSLSLDVALQIGKKELNDQVSNSLDGVKFDTTTKSLETAREQLERVIRESFYSYVPGCNPLFVEQHWIIDFKDYPFLRLSMQPDVIAESFGLPQVDDHKFPRVVGNYSGQGGGYMKGYEAVSGERLRRFSLQVIKRVSLGSPPAELQEIIYSRDQCLDSFDQAIKGIGQKADAWRADKDKKIFDYNPNSKYCTQETCPAFGGDWCNRWIDTKKEKKN